MNFVHGKRLLANRAIWSDRVGFALFERRGEKTAYSKSVVMFVPEVDGTSIEPTFYLESDEVQELMDNLWHLGFRPSEGTGSAGALAATQKHLEDMRKIAFDLIGEIIRDGK